MQTGFVMVGSSDAPRHRTGGNVTLPSRDLQQAFSRWQSFDIASPVLSPRSSGEAWPCWQKLRRASMVAIGSKEQMSLSKLNLGGALLAFVLGIICLWKLTASNSGVQIRFDDGEQAVPDFDKMYGDKLKNITASVVMLHGLHRVVIKADETYEDVYHNQLVQQNSPTHQPEELDWNAFVQEARSTGPTFLDGKESLRDGVASMHRLIRRSPEYLRSLVTYLRQGEAEEASWYMSKVVKLVDSVLAGMDKAAEKFAQVASTVEAMSRDAKENVEHLDEKQLQLELEARALESTPSVKSGRWARSQDIALTGCYLDKSRTSLEDCKVRCLSHLTGACSHITFYKTASWSTCYLHCDSARHSFYREADTYALERAPQDLVADAAMKREVGSFVGRLVMRWQNVQTPLKDVTQLVRRFRAATADLRKSLEEVRFAVDDLKALLASPSKEQQLQSFDRRVREMLTAVEDLGDSLAPLRFQSSS